MMVNEESQKVFFCSKVFLSRFKNDHVMKEINARHSLPFLCPLKRGLPSIYEEAFCFRTFPKLRKELLVWRRVLAQQGLMREALPDLLGHPVIGQDHAFSHRLMDLQGLLGDEVMNVLSFIKLHSNLHAFQFQGTTAVSLCSDMTSYVSQLCNCPH
jgi:hypothetical protein